MTAQIHHRPSLLFRSICLRPIAVLATVATLAGCAQMPMQTASKPPLAIDSADPCGAQRADFAKSKDYFTDQIVTGAVTGAALGALAGVGLALVTHSNVGTAALIGGGTGLLAGGTTAYTKTLAEKSKDQAEMAQHVNDDLRREGDEIDHTTAAFARLRSCRYQQAALIKAQVRRHAMTRPDGLTQIAFERDRFDEELKLAREYDIAMTKRGSQFDDAAKSLNENPTPAAAPSAKLVSAAASVSIPEKRSGFDKSLVAAESSSKLAFDMDNNTKLTQRLGAGRAA
jgi:hypothetical protein